MNVKDGSAARRWRRVLGIVFGLGTQLLFAYTVWHLFWFLRDGGGSEARGSLALDALLALQFAVPHSLLLLPRTRAFVTRYIAGEFYCSLYCVATCGGLLVVFGWWHSSPVVVWQAEGLAAAVIRTGFYGSWVALFYSLHLTGLGNQTGLTHWWYWLRRLPQPRREFAECGAYRWLRHPIYLSFLGLVWFTPRMTLDHAVLTGLWTVYIFVGSHLKDERLIFYLGDVYRDYAARVPGYPLVGFGPLGRRPPRASSPAAATALSDGPPPAQQAA